MGLCSPSIHLWGTKTHTCPPGGRQGRCSGAMAALASWRATKTQWSGNRIRELRTRESDLAVPQKTMAFAIVCSPHLTWGAACISH